MKLGPKVKVIATLAAATLALGACSSGAGASNGAASTTLTLGNLQDVTSFDPAQGHIGYPMEYFQPVYDSLLRRLPNGTLVPMLATSWSYNANNTVLTLKLRSGVKFSDGTALDAAAVKVNLDRFRTGNGPDAATMAQVTNVEAKDPTTVVLTLSAPNPALLQYLGNEDGFIASPKAIAAGHIATAPVGSGPYTYDAAASVAGSKYTFVKTANYWDPSLQKYNTIVVKPITDTTAMLNSLISGQVDAAPLTAKTAPQAKSGGFTSVNFSTDWQGLLIFDRAGKTVPALKDVRVRQAINYAIDKNTLLKQVQGGLGTVTSQVFGTQTPAFQPSLENAYTYDPAKAKALMAAAGYAKGFSVSMPTSAGAIDPALQAGIGQNLADIGITVNWVNVPISNFVADLVQGKFAMSWFSLFQGTPWVAANQMLTPDATYNPDHTTDPQVEALLHTIQTGDTSAVDAASKQLGSYVTEQAWFAPFYRPAQIYYTDTKVTVQPTSAQAIPSIYNYAPAK